MPNAGEMTKENSLGTKQKMPNVMGLRRHLHLCQVCAANGLVNLNKAVTVGKPINKSDP
jgi:hypothetical protein